KESTAAPLTSIQLSLPSSSQSQSSPSPSSRKAIPNYIKHQVTLRDRGQCKYVDADTKVKCKQTRFLELHHRKPVSMGGEDNASNLVTLCAEHHRHLHDMGNINDKR